MFLPHYYLTPSLITATHFSHTQAEVAEEVAALQAAMGAQHAVEMGELERCRNVVSIETLNGWFIFAFAALHNTLTRVINFIVLLLH